MTKVTISLPGIDTQRYRSSKTGLERVYYYHKATRTRLPDDPTSPEFLAMVRQLDAKGARRPVPADRTLGHLIELYKQSSWYLELRATTRSEYDRHLKYLEALRDQPAAGFTRVHADALKTKYLAKGHKELGHAVVRTLSVLLSYAVFLKWFDRNPLFGRTVGEKRRRSEVGQRPYEEHEIGAFRDANPLGSRARLSFELALSTGFRIEDLPEVPRESVSAGQVTIITRKSGSLVVAPITEIARAALLAFEDTRRAHMGAAFEPSRYAVSTLDGGKIAKRRLSGELRDAYIAAGFEEGQRTHALRYTAAVRLFELGFHFDDIADLVGHAGADMTRQYLVKKRKAKLVGRLLDAIDPSDPRLHAPGGTDQLLQLAAAGATQVHLSSTPAAKTTKMVGERKARIVAARGG
ncbi:site-specific integrase [Cereibacter johrii]|uniref:tyrosine-type recombinase/integrase n=1 Tax=Cereibacter johrii TaxID=445629 RepID=UPI002B263804|nr:site-specific integrase [Cereibacter johrii]MEA5159818.1 site-specific integrase [Cereibacter johrii]